ncbi:helix-turn-helix domain-containing protein [Nonomuraea sp. NBC_01738]|uniref:helix-turn-helix domain-containing protein n=1 Tax=Nonomuraea sp. NBC_01738 TaxID=2976003 RepID=UPI002E1216C6|nr:helix-turn-helix domain-containing protein [Nonomuraea sp. NBC_01738]
MPKRNPASPSDWAVTYTRTVAAAIRHHRKRQGLSVQSVADRCTDLGYPIERTNLAKLEGGARTSMSVAELLVLARALDTPPLTLLAPIGQDAPTEILPGIETAPGEAAAWLDGTTPPPDAPHDDAGADLRAELQALRDHHRLVAEWTARTRSAEAAGERAADDTDPHGKAWAEAVALHARHAGHAADQLAFLRAAMRARGEALPYLPPGLIHLE